MMHFHDGYEIFFTLTDSVYYYVENQKFCLKKGGLMLINNNELHRSQPPREGMYERYIVSFVPDYISDYDNLEGIDLFGPFTDRPGGKVGSVQLMPEQIREFTEHLDRAIYYQEEKTEGWEVLQKLELVQILLLCIGYFNHSLPEPPQEQPIERLRPILQYIKQHPGADLSLERLSEDFYISKSHLIRLFKLSTGLTPNQYIIMIRVMKARKYLVEGIPILKVCELVGYSDESHFIRTFRKIVGVTPKKYAQLRQRKKEDE
ncbi:MAG: AraC family transcriptional regulator [Eubacteriales bacterium]|nr:AraC family transcriptional regulator [Eubacteriales bacterium]